MALDGDSGVNYTVKELLARLDAKLDTIALKLENKAERATVHELAGRIAALEMTALRHAGPVSQKVDSLETRIGDLEKFRAGSLVLSSWQRWFLGTVVVGMLGAVATLVWLAASH